MQYLLCRILQSETQTDQQVQSKLFPPVGVLPCPSFSILLLGLFTVATGRTSDRKCLNEDQASEHWKTKGLQICKEDTRLSQKTILCGNTSLWAERRNDETCVCEWLWPIEYEPKIPTVPCRSMSYSRNQCAKFGCHRSWRGWFFQRWRKECKRPSNWSSWHDIPKSDGCVNLFVGPSRPAKTEDLTLNDWAFELMTLCIVRHVFWNQLKVGWFHA